MSWVKVDDGFPDHPKLQALGDLAPMAGWLYLAATCYCSRHLTDGYVPAATVPRLAAFPPKVKPAHIADMLVSVGLWETAEGGYQVHDYLVYNPSREATLGKRAAWADRQRKSRGESQPESRSDSRVTPRADDARDSTSPVPLSRAPSRSASHEAHSVRDGLPNLNPEAIAVLERHTRRPWSQAGDKQMSEFDRLVGDHGLPAVDRTFGQIAGNTAMTARQLVWAAVKSLEPIPDAKSMKVAESENREAIRSRRAVQATKKRTHDLGYHADEPDPMCDACQGGKAA